MQDLADYTADCRTCERNRYIIDASSDTARARICRDCFEVCVGCDGSEYTYERDERGYRVARKCPVCGPLKQRVEAFNNAAIPRRHAHSTLSTDSFRVRHRRDDGTLGATIGNLSGVRTRLDNWARGFEPGERGFLLHGDVGTGKTHLLAGTVRYLTLEKGIPVKFVEFTHLLSRLRRQFDRGRGETSVLDPLVELPVLAIDELGKGRNTDWQLSIIDEIISKRYNRDLTTLFTTNYPLDTADIPSGDATDEQFHRQATASTLEERVGERVYSRLFDMAEFIELNAPDYRRHNNDH